MGGVRLVMGKSEDGIGIGIGIDRKGKCEGNIEGRGNGDAWGGVLRGGRKKERG